jgi:Helix-turn-helix of DDE superfamily endonuclease
MPLPVLLVLIHLRTNLTTRMLAALFHTSQSVVDRIIHHWCRCWREHFTPTLTGMTDSGASTAP